MTSSSSVKQLNCLSAHRIISNQPPLPSQPPNAPRATHWNGFLLGISKIWSQRWWLKQEINNVLHRRRLSTPTSGSGFSVRWEILRGAERLAMILVYGPCCPLHAYVPLFRFSIMHSIYSLSHSLSALLYPGCLEWFAGISSQRGIGRRDHGCTAHVTEMAPVYDITV